MSYQDVKDRLYHGHRRIANNTYITLEDGGTVDVPGEYVDMRLHGNLIAGFFPHYLQLYSAGWHTTTTKNRLNLALELANIVRAHIVQSNWDWFYLTGIMPPVPFYDGIKIDYTGNIIK